MTQESNAYILGTDREELHRLGLQHQVWASEAHGAWQNAGFKEGDQILDLGCGPGFCTRELAYLVGDTGGVIGIDKSQAYIEYARNWSLNEGLDIDYRILDMEEAEDMNDLPASFFDGIYTRWALAWVKDPKAIVQSCFNLLKPGGRMVFQEYFYWASLQTEPSFPTLKKVISMALGSMKPPKGQQFPNIDVGRYLPTFLAQTGMEQIRLRKLTKLVQPHQYEWQWPKTFFNIYFPKLVGHLITQEECDLALRELKELEKIDHAAIWTPLMVEVIASKPMQ